VWGSFDEGASWTNLTLNLPTFTGQIRSLEIVRSGGEDEDVVLTAGGLGGVFQLQNPRPPDWTSQWTALGKRLPHGLVLDLHYDSTADVLLAGLLGRGAWTLRHPVRGEDDADDDSEAVPESEASWANRAAAIADVPAIGEDTVVLPPQAVSEP
jgi:hypothetical protein